jgi:tetratricopeptide (TPR) repeat protein
MYIKGRRWNMRQPRRYTNFWLLLALILVAAFLFYVNKVVEPLSPTLFLPSPTPTISPENFVSQAETLASQGKYTQALQEYQQALQADPKNPSYYIAMARLDIFSGNYTEAVTNASNALLLGNTSSQAEALKGFGLAFIGDFLQGAASLNRAIELDGGNASAYAYQSILYTQQIISGQGAVTNLDKAIEASRKALSLAPNALETHWARGLVLEITANYQQAIAEFEAATAQNNNISELHMALGRNYRSLQKNDRAVEEFTRASALNPTDPNPALNISRIYAGIGEFGRAVQYAEQAVSISPADPFMYGNLGSLYFRNRQSDKALFALRLAIQGGVTPEGLVVEGIPLAPGRVGEYYYTYGLTLRNLGYCNEARQIARAVIQALPEDEIAQYNGQYVLDNCPINPAVPTPTMLPTPTARPTVTPTVLPSLTPSPTP